MVRVTWTRPVMPWYMGVWSDRWRDRCTEAGSYRRPLTPMQRRALADVYLGEATDDRPARTPAGRRRSIAVERPTGAERERVWRAYTRNWRRCRVFHIRLQRALKDAPKYLESVEPALTSMAEQAQKTAKTIEDTLLDKVSRVELYDIAWNMYQEAWKAERLAKRALALVCILAIAFIVHTIACLAVAP